MSFRELILSDDVGVLCLASGSCKFTECLLKKTCSQDMKYKDVY